MVSTACTGFSVLGVSEVIGRDCYRIEKGKAIALFCSTHWVATSLCFFGC
jgi:hypothetical protein